MDCLAIGSAKDALGGADSALYSARMMLHGNGHDVWEMTVENFPLSYSRFRADLFGS